MKLEDRPASFMTADGKEIAVDKNVAAINDGVVQRGKVTIILISTLSISDRFACEPDL